MYLCKVCGYSKLEYPQYNENGTPNFTICECCGFEAGFDDLDQGISIEEYRREWIEKGAKWLTPEKKPSKWNLEEQLRNII